MQFYKTSESTRLIVTGVIMSIILMLPQMNVGSHNPIASLEAGIERHMALEFETFDISPHTHENGTDEEWNLVHQHGHNHADHTHNPLYISSQNMWPGTSNIVGLTDYIRSHTSPIPFLWQRPPKPNHVS